MKAVIIGNSIAGIAATLGFREHSKDDDLVMISREPYRPYSRPLISYYLAGKVAEEKMYYRGPKFNDALQTESMLGTTVKQIDTDQRRILLDGGEEMAFDKLLIATGGTPFVPPIDNLAGKEYFTFTTWDDAKRIQKLIPNVRHAVVLGGGLIGLKVAEALNTLHVKTSVIELADRVLSPALDTRSSAMMRRALEEAGIDVITGDTVASVEGTGSQIERAILRSGQALPCDLLVVAIGVVPNTALTKETDIKVNRGIIIDQRMQTNIDGIYAAGDVAEGADSLIGVSRVIPIWPSAYHQGYAAGCNMAGADSTFGGNFAMNSVDVNGTSIISLGLSTVEDGSDYEILSDYNDRRREYRKIVLKDDVIVGAVFVNGIDRAGIVTGLIKDCINVRNFKEALSRDNFGYISLPRELRKTRLETLGAKL